MKDILLKDAKELLQLFKQEQDIERRKQIAYDFMGIIDMLKKFFMEEGPLVIPKEFNKYFQMKKNDVDKDRENVNNQIYNNLNRLEKIYTDFLNHFVTLDFANYEMVEVEEKYDEEVLDNFFEKYSLTDEYKRIVDGDRLFFFKNYDVASSVTLRSIDKQYMYLHFGDSFDDMKYFAHEMGHMHANNILGNDEKRHVGFLNEFMSITFENLFILNSNVDENIRRKAVVNNIMGSYMIVRQALAQLYLMEQYNDAFEKMDLNLIYKNILDKICSVPSKTKRESLELQFYALGFLLAITFIKKNMCFEEIDKFFIDNYDLNDLNKILDFIDINLVNEFLTECINGKGKIKSIK